MTPDERLDELDEALEEHLEGFEGCERSRDFGEITLTVPREKLLNVMRILRQTRSLAFELCMDVCGVDYTGYGATEWVTGDAANSGFGRGADRGDMPAPEADNRFAVVYHLLSTSLNHRLRVKVMLNAEFPVVDSVCEIWTGVDWFERETFDMFGILFNGHPDLRRILTDYGFIGHPMRKDFPLAGEVEMHYDPELGRVVYVPVSIEARTLVPRVVRKDSRYEQGWKPEPVAEAGEADA